MRLLDRYILQQYIKTFVVIIFSFLTLFLVIDFIDRIPRLVRRGASLHYTLLYFSLRLPYLFIITSPVGVLLSGLFLMDKLSKYNESVAIRAAGISIFRMMRPLLIFSFFFSIFVLFFTELILPKSEDYRSYIYTVKIKNQEMKDIKMKSNIYYKGENNTIFSIGFFDGYRNVMKNVDITVFDEDNKIKKKMQSPFVKWDSKTNNWIFERYHLREFSDEKLLSVKSGKSIESKLIMEKPEDFIKRTKRAMSMNYFELKDYIKSLKSIGENFQREEVELYTKLAFPFANFFIIMFCVPLASASVRTKGRGYIFVGGLLVAFLYLSSVRIGQSMGFNGVLPPFLSVWLGNIFFGIIVLLFIIKAEV